MKDRAYAFLRQMAALWAAFSTAKRLALIVVVLGVAGAVLAVSVLSTRTTYAYLFTDLTPEDAAAISTKLKELKVPYRLENGGAAIQVAEEKVHEIRLDLASAGLPRGGGVGFEIFDKSHLGATEFEQRINLRRALEGELARTIGTIGAVQSARVHLVLPERSMFAMGREPSSASVILKLRPGRPFGREEVASVVHLVASAVPGLTPNRVSIVSADGTILHRPKTDGAGDGLSGDDTDAERTREMQTSLEDRARTLLERMVGPGHADVRIGVSFDGATHERTEEHSDPNKSALRSEQKTEEHGGVGAPNVAGVPGAASNLPAGTEAEKADSNNPLASSGFRTSWTRNWEIDRVVERTTTPSGKLARLTIAVLVDGTYKGHDFIPRDHAELDRIAELVKGAVGFDAQRGDALQIESAAFAHDDAVEEKPAAPAGLPRPVWLKWAVAGIAGVFALAVLVLVWRSRRRGRVLALSAAASAAELAGVAAPAALPEASVEQDPVVARSQALALASRDPATAAVILRGWLNAPSSVEARR